MLHRTIIALALILGPAAALAQDVGSNGLGVDLGDAFVKPPGGPGPGSDTTPPGKPVLTIVITSPTEIAISWTAPSDDGFVGNTKVTSYDLRYRDGASFDPALWDDFATDSIAGVPAPPSAPGSQETVTMNVPANCTLTFRLKSIDDKGNFSLTDPTTVSLDSIDPGKVLALDIVSSTQNSVVLSWGATGDDVYAGPVDSYTVHYSASAFSMGQEAALIADASTQHKTVSPADISFFTIAGLEEATLYCFTVTGTDENDNEGAPADIVTVLTGVSGGSESAANAAGCSGSSAGHAGTLIGLAILVFLRRR